LSRGNGDEKKWVQSVFVDRLPCRFALVSRGRGSGIAFVPPAQNRSGLQTFKEVLFSGVVGFGLGLILLLMD
jgi:hypothetical protein